VCYLITITTAIHLNTYTILPHIVVQKFISEQELAGTYDNGWETVSQYREAVSLRESNPDMARAEIARRVGRPPSALRGWLAEGKTPTVLKGVREASQNGWIDVESTSEQFRALNQLVAWIFSGGGVDKRSFVPHFSVDDSVTLSTIDRLLRWVNLSYRIDDRPERGQVIIPSESASVFGRVLSVLEVPTGIKAEKKNLTVPDYVFAVGEEHQRDFLRVYILNRGRDLITDRTAGTYLHAFNSTKFCRELKSLIESVTPGTATIGEQNEVWISSESVRDLAGKEPIRTALATQAAFGSLTPPTERAFASTYREGQNPSGFQYLQLYRQLIDRDESRSKLAYETGVRESTIQSWRRGSKPYVQNGLENAIEYGWITPTTESDVALGLTSLVAWVHARGGIRDTYYPDFGISSSKQRMHFKEIANDLGISYNVIREGDSERQTEIRISENGTALGRVLYTLGAPLRKSTETEHLPPTYLYHYEPHARQFVTTWCVHHAEGDEELSITVPPRIGTRFADGLEALLTEQLSWSASRVGEYKIETVPDSSD
jgi:hypothetical protein